MTSAIDPVATALLVMDYQSGIVDRLTDPDELLDRAATAIETVRRHGGRIGYVRVAFADSDYESVPEHSRFAQLLADRERTLHDDHPATAVHERVAPQAGDIVVRKVRVGAFSTTDLHEQLQRVGVTNLILAGISTSGVVLSTVRDAADRDYRVFVLADATADPRPGVHEFLTEQIFPTQAQVITLDQLDGLLSGAGGSG